jgi:serine/threonine protein kinase
MILEPGFRLINRYEIKHSLGGGSFGTVYLAFDEKMRDEIAIKELRTEWLFDQTIRQRFVNEVRAMRQLQSPNVVIGYDLLEPGKDPVDNYYIIMEYVRGGSLEGLAKRKQPLPINEILKITIDICRALELAHARNIYHRDIKPDNILVGIFGEGKLSDFGISHIPGSGSSGQQVGTLIWMAPEQAKGEKNVDGKADIYSLAAVLYKLLTRRYHLDFEDCFLKARLIDHKNEEEENHYIRNAVCELIKNTRPELPTVYRSEIPSRLEFVIMKNLDFDPRERYSAAQLAGELSTILKSIDDIDVTNELQSARALIKENNLNKAVKIVEKILAKHSDNASAHELMGDIHYRRKEYSSAILQWEATAELPSASPGIYLKLGNLYNLKEQFASAVKVYQKGIRLNPTDHKLLYALAMSEWGNGSHVAAIASLITSNQQHPDRLKEALLERWKEESQNKKNKDNTLHG